MTSRRAFLATFGLAVAGVLGAGACLSAPPGRVGTGSALPPYAGAAVQSAPAGAAAQPAPAAPGSMSGMAMTDSSPMTKAVEMDAHHAAGVKLFPAETAVHGNQLLQPRLEGDVKVFELTAAKTKWEIEPGKLVDAYAYNGTVPGPQIRVTEGDRVRVVLKNAMDESTAIHFHGQRTPNKMDGVPFITQDPVRPGESFAYEFVARPAGSHMYHSHHNSSVQVPGGLLGAFIVEPKVPTVAYEVEHLLVLNDGPHGFTLNGKSFPATQPLTAKVGQRVLIRYMNEGSMIHPMHLHGFPQQVVAKDGYPQTPWLCDTLLVAPGDRWDVLVEPDEPGVWAFHCHILPHAEATTGMFGMVTALVVEK